MTIPPLQSNCWLLHGQIGCSSLDEALSISIAQLDPALPPSNVSVGHFVYIEKQGWDGQRYHAEPPYWGRYACAIIADDAEAAKSVLGVRVPGRVACWGSFPEPMLDASGQALSPQQDVLVETRGPTWLPFDGVLELALGPSHMCVVTSDERVLCWGENDYGQLGVEPRPTSSATPLFIPDLDDAVDLAAGEDHACVKRKDGSVWCWGSNEHDQLGRETRWKRWAVPLKNVAFDGDVRQLGVGWDDTCVCYADGRFHCIQHEHYPFTEGEEASPVTFEAQDLSVSGMRLCLIHSDHKLYCAGEYYYGAGIYLSHEDMFSASTRDLIGRLKRVHVGREMDCGIRRDDRVVCWGWVPNLPGAECERPDPSCFVIAKPFASLGRVQSLAVNAATACALTQNDGRVVCWGSNDGFVPETGEMVEIEGLEKVKALSGYVGYCALHEDGGVSCWKLSLGLDGEPFTAPARIAGISDAVQIAVGGAFACARHADGRVSCWGDGEYGQLGIPNRYEVVELPWKTLLDDETKVLQQPAD
ncbi:MAG: hypothetical protein RBU37_28030 [Myxococcota bacterium]|nr:hypothetical protein [Myxococcota bacterium]